MSINSATAEYIQGLVNNKKRLTENLNAMGVSAGDGELFDSLIEKVLTVPHHFGIETDTWLPVTNSTEYTVESLNFIPAKIAMACDDVLSGGSSMVVPNTNLIAIFNVDFPLDDTKLIELDSKGSIVLESFSSGAIVTVSKASDGSYSAKISLEELNAVAATPYLFKGSYEHTFIIVSEEWFNQ